MITYSGLLFFLLTYMTLSTDIQTSEKQLDEILSEVYPRAAEAVPANVPAKMQSLSSMYEKTKHIWTEDTLEWIEIYAANDVNANVRFRRSETDITYNPSDEIVFNGITGERIIEPELEYTVAGTIQNGFFSLHEGQFAGTIARWFTSLPG